MGVVVCGWVVCMDNAAGPFLYVECGVAERELGSRKGRAVLQFSLE